MRARRTIVFELMCVDLVSAVPQGTASATKMRNPPYDVAHSRGRNI